MPQVQLSLTELGNKLLIQQGAAKTFKKFTVTDDGYRYDITETVDLTDKLQGGLRTLVTTAPVSEYATTKNISKTNLTAEELRQTNMKLEWEVSLTDGTQNYSARNPKIHVNLKRWFNYLTSLIGEENYNYNNKMVLNLFDNISAITTELDPSTFTYVKKQTTNTLDIAYKLDTTTSTNNYSKLNAYLMTIKDGQKILQDNTQERFPSPFILAFDTEENVEGTGDTLKLTMTPITWGYVVKSVDDMTTTFYKSDFVSITSLESMKADDINKKYRIILPACITSYKNSNDTLFYLTDVNGSYTNSYDVLSTYTYRFKNSEGKTLIQSLIEKAQNFIQTNFIEVTPGVYQNKMGLKINNNRLNGFTYPEQQVVGGNIEVILEWDTSDVTVPTNNNDAVSWL